ncbi:RNA polymerase sigma factor [Macellibacteroides fermentans]|jgi:RNA polymerase sigma-70 factor (ECF subfamily)|uniref:RNA polymerase sigma-70 factor (ECF subfamily) n=1 Tax=Macellibacteroides fermentans TaxID=879969 RepID=A0A8E1ZUP8_9PORP|nr:RNA polymerase sigma-70 factor [Macellibacteroides fermentans]NYI48809.1 RNA polymerase sigma-70 factor (ECF subfamily) [Macellibacteroides fermentans]HML72752.1 RNA polymerase sigma-70 factor [Macellibacteroides fermentans]
MNLIIKQLQDGNEKVFEQIVREYWPRMFKFALIYTQNNETSQELVQDTFLVLWNNRAILKDNTNLITYLMVVLRNKCLNLLEQTRIRQLYIEEIDDETIYQRANLYVLQDEASQIVESEDLHKAIERALSKLPDKTREIFMLSRYDGLKNQQIAETKNISQKTVEYHISKALQILKEELPQEYWIWIFLIRFII